MKKNFESIGFRLADVIFLSGVTVMISAIIYMVLNLYRADSIIQNWIFLMASGISLSFIAMLMKPRLITGRREKEKLRLKY